MQNDLLAFRQFSLKKDHWKIIIARNTIHYIVKASMVDIIRLSMQWSALKDLHSFTFALFTSIILTSINTNYL